MTKRDLKADLALVRQSGFYSSIGGVWKIAEHAIERAIKAEALVQESAKALDAIFEYEQKKTYKIPPFDKTPLGIRAANALDKAKEVLEDE